MRRTSLNTRDLWSDWIINSLHLLKPVACFGWKLNDQKSIHQNFVRQEVKQKQSTSPEQNFLQPAKPKWTQLWSAPPPSCEPPPSTDSSSAPPPAPPPSPASAATTRQTFPPAKHNKGGRVASRRSAPPHPRLPSSVCCFSPPPPKKRAKIKLLLLPNDS